MYERFTDLARQTLSLANQEAHRFAHEYVGTEHLLLGIVKNKTCLASTLLGKLGVDLRKVRLEVEKTVQAGPNGDMMIAGRLPMTPRAKKVIELAVAAAQEEHKAYVGTEHLMIALIRENEGTAYQVLSNLGVTESLLRDLMNTEGLTRFTAEQERVLEDLYRRKEEAVLDQNFEEATRLRDQADLYKKSVLREHVGKEKIETAVNEQNAEEIIRQVTCVLLFHTTKQQSAAATLDQIRQLVEGAQL